MHTVQFYSTCMYVYMYITYNKGKDQPGKVTNLARGQGSPAPHQPAQSPYSG